jgi:hypothetical protein
VVSDQSSSSSDEALDRTMRDASTPKGTRRWLLERSAVGAAGITAASALVPAGDALASAQHDSKPHDSIDEWGVFASTTEALTVTILTELLRRASLNRVPSSVSVIFDGVYAAELDHWNFIHRVFRPSTRRFWIPDGFFGGAGDALDLTAVGRGVAAGEHLFINTYLLGVTIFAAAGPIDVCPLRRRRGRASSCLGGFWPAQARPTISDSRCSSLRPSAQSRPPSWAPDSDWGSRARLPGASTGSRTRRCRLRSRSAEIPRRRPNTRRSNDHSSFQSGSRPDKSDEVMAGLARDHPRHEPRMAS